MKIITAFLDFGKGSDYFFYLFPLKNFVPTLKFSFRTFAAEILNNHITIKMQTYEKKRNYESTYNDGCGDDAGGLCFLSSCG